MTCPAGDIRFALLGHPADYNHFVRLSETVNEPATRRRLYDHKKSIIKFVEWMPSYVTNHRPFVRLQGANLEGRLIVCPFFPDQIKSPRQLACAYNKVVAGCELAKQIGASVVSLGGYTSILEGANGNNTAEQLGLTITSGNSLTAALAVAQLKAVLAQTRRPIEKEIIAIVGATGDVGRVCVFLLASLARKLILIARNRARLEALAVQIESRLPVEIAMEVKAARSARIVILAASAAEPVLDESDLAARTIVCDVGYPKNLSDGSRRRDDVLIFAGGLAKLPEPVDLQSYCGLPEQNLLHGCFCEGIVLACLQNGKLATGQGHADVDRATALFDAATALGIEPAPIYRGDQLISEEDMVAFGQRGDMACL